jgi:hypothetical protein
MADASAPGDVASFFKDITDQVCEGRDINADDADKAVTLIAEGEGGPPSKFLRKPIHIDLTPPLQLIRSKQLLSSPR